VALHLGPPGAQLSGTHALPWAGQRIHGWAQSSLDVDGDLFLDGAAGWGGVTQLGQSGSGLPDMTIGFSAEIGGGWQRSTSRWSATINGETITEESTYRGPSGRAAVELRLDLAGRWVALGVLLRGAAFVMDTSLNGERLGVTTDLFWEPGVALRIGPPRAYLQVGLVLPYPLHRVKGALPSPWLGVGVVVGWLEGAEWRKAR